MESEQGNSIRPPETPNADAPIGIGQAITVPQEPSLEDLDETTLKGLQILARILVRAYLRRVGAWHSPDCDGVFADADHTDDAAPDPPAARMAGD